MWCPEHRPSYFTVMGLDPGSSTLGVSKFTLDAYSYEIVASEAHTLHLERLAPKNTYLEEGYGRRYTRLQYAESLLLEEFCRGLPVAIASESPFFNPRNPSAFEPLVETMCAIRNAAIAYDPQLTLYRIDPPSVKQGVGAPTRAPKGVDVKLLVRDSVLRLGDLNYNGRIPLTLLDEHSIDSIAVGYTYIKRLREGTL